MLPGALYRVRLNDGSELLAAMSPRMKHTVVRLIGGSKVEVERSSRDPKRGQIVAKL